MEWGGDQEAKRERTGTPRTQGWSPVCAHLKDSRGIHKGSDRPSLSQTTDQESPPGKKVAADGN